MEYLFDYIVIHNLVDVYKLYELLNIKAWREYILNASEDVAELLSCYEQTKKILYFDVNVYDQYYYKRQVLCNTLPPQIQQLSKLKFSKIEITEDISLDDENVKEIIYFIGDTEVPDEYKLFLQIYQQNPSVFVRLYNYDVIDKMVVYNKTLLKSRIRQICETSTITNCLLLYPLVYSKHYKTNINDTEYINVLCYINIIDDNLKNVPLGDRYIYLRINVADLENNNAHYDTLINYLKEITCSILNDGPKVKDFYYPQDLLSASQTFDKCISQLLLNQKFYLWKRNLF